MPESYSSTEVVLASEATDFYNQSQLDACWTHMRKLHSTRSSDPKVLANKALIDLLHRSNSTRSDEYLTQLQKAASLAGSPLFIKNDSDSHPDTLQPASPSASPAVLSIHYNYALVMFHRRQFVRSERLLAGLLGVEALATAPTAAQLPMCAGSLLCQRCILLWLDVCLCLNRPQRVYDFTSHWLHQLESVNASAGTPADTQVTETLTAIAQPLRVFRLRAALLTGRLKFAEEEVAQLSKSLKEFPDKTWDTSRSLEYARAQLLFLKRDHMKAIKCLNSLQITSSNPYSTETEWECPLAWNNLSLSHFCAGQLSLATLKMRRALRQTDRLTSNLIDCSSVSTSEGGGGSGGGANAQGSRSESHVTQLIRQIPLQQLGVSQHHALLHNAGVQFLFTQRPESAFNALLSVVRVYPRNPRLWLRLAECCVRVQRPDTLSDWKVEARAGCLIGTLGEGYARKLIIGANPDESEKPWIESATMPTPTLEFAALCLRNALFLLPRPPTDLGDASTSSEGTAVERQRIALAVPVLPSCQPLSGMALLQVTSATLLTSAYVALCLQNPVEAMHYAQQVLCVVPPGDGSTDSGGSTTTSSFSGAFGWIGLLSPPAHRYLAKIYLAEARVALDQVHEACITLLAKDYVEPSEPPLPSSTHPTASYAALQRDCATLLPDFQLPQTHPLCGVPADFATSSTRASSSHLEGIAMLREDQHETEPGPRQLMAPKNPDFPLTMEQLRCFVFQAVGVLLYNMAVCLAVRGDYSGSRQVLENAAPALFINELDPYGPQTIRIGSEEHHRLLYPPDASNGAISCVLPNHHFPSHFLRLWLYLELCEDKVSSAVQFARAYLGHVAFANRFTDIAPKEECAKEPTPPVVFEIGGGGGASLNSDQMPNYADFIRQQFGAPQGRRMAPLKPSQSAPLQIQDPPTSTANAAAPCWTDADWPPL
ncbi:unnamed protein product [Mesocestoides corti]|uniref:CCR4-NOT transcription complex subunit 10 n=1 Tax=Mesocestoides corti TaxID=53468 RepID=A0A158QT85_MESCO|nr:unnamed protein product [Mesocestoides corti]